MPVSLHLPVADHCGNLCRRKSLCTEGQTPKYTVHPGTPLQPLRCFSSQLLHPVVVHPNLPWGLMPGWSAYGPLPDAPGAANASQLAMGVARTDEPTPRLVQSALENRSVMPGTALEVKPIFNLLIMTTAFLASSGANRHTWTPPHPWDSACERPCADIRAICLVIEICSCLQYVICLPQQIFRGGLLEASGQQSGCGHSPPADLKRHSRG